MIDREDAHVEVVVAVLTYRRPADLAIILPLLVAQAEGVAGKHFAVDILVLDNDPAGSGRGVVELLNNPRVRYVQEVEPGVAAARNRALAEAEDYDLLVFIDDDEHPAEVWLRDLLAVHRRYGPAGVAGRVVPAYDGEVDPWIAAGRFFVRRTLPTGTEVAAAGAGNLLLDLRDVRTYGLQFDPEFGLSGGEDTLFTRTLTAQGGRILWCDEAVAFDRVPAERATRTWVLARAFSHGNTAGHIDVRLAGSQPAVVARGKIAVRGLTRIVGGSLQALFGLLSGRKRDHARGLRAVWRGAGMMVAALGLVYQEYSRTGRKLVSPGRIAREHALARATAHPAASVDQRPVTVLLSFPKQPPRGNPYRVLLQSALTAEPSLQVLNFTWRTALLGRYDVFHVHWPEILVSGATPARMLVRQSLFVLLLMRMAVQGVPLVRTVHNLELPQGISWRERFLLRWADRQTRLRIRINETTEFPSGTSFETSLHGHYRDWFEQYPLPVTAPGRVLFFGLVRRYKGVDHLISAFRQLSDPAASLHVVGQPSTGELADQLNALAAGDPRIALKLNYISDEALVEEVGRAEVVVLPYREMHNSAGVLTALSLGRPVLVPDNRVNQLLSQEVGAGWVRMYTGELTPSDIESALADARQARAGDPPDLTRREWDEAGRAHAVAYRRAIETGRRRTGSR